MTMKIRKRPMTLSRREVLSGLAATALAAKSAAAATPGARPNIIFFLTDDQRWDTLGVTGNSVVKTPRIDSMGQRGVVFQRAYVTTSICPISRASILTGQYARRHGIVDFSRPIGDGLFAQTYPALLKAAGYFTGFVGKYGVGPAYPNDKFDFIRAFNGQGHYEIKNAGGEVRHMTEANGDDALEFLKQREPGKPFCLSVSFKAPHAEDDDPRQFIFDRRDKDLYSGVEIPLPPGFDGNGFDSFPEFFKRDNESRRRWALRFSTPDLFQTMVKAYYRLITGIDREVGRVLAEVELQEELHNTIVVLTSDNGFYLGEHGLADKWFGHDPSIRVPLVITDFRRPAEAMRRIDALALNIDVAPTILSLAGVPAPARMQGRDLSPWLTGVPAPSWRQDFLYENLFEHPGIPKSEGVAGGRYKYMRYWRGQDQYEELFDLATDPLELHNLTMSPQSQDLADALRARTRQLVAEAA